MLPPWFWYGLGTIAVVFCVAMARLAREPAPSPQTPPQTLFVTFPETLEAGKVYTTVVKEDERWARTVALMNVTHATIWTGEEWAEAERIREKIQKDKPK